MLIEDEIIIDILNFPNEGTVFVPRQINTEVASGDNPINSEIASGDESIYTER